MSPVTATITSRFILEDSGGTDVSDRLRQAASLHEDGILTDDEYEAKKAELLERM